MSITGAEIRPVHQVYTPGVKTFVGFELEVELRVYDDLPISKPIRVNFVGINTWAGGCWTFFNLSNMTKNVFPPASYTGFVTRREAVMVNFGSYFDWATRPAGDPSTWDPPFVLPPTHRYDGIAPIADPDVAPRPRHYWQIADVNPAQGMGSYVSIMDPLTAGVGTKVSIRFTKTGTVVDPPGTLHKDINGANTPLIGTFITWLIEWKFPGLGWQDIATFYAPVDKIDYLNNLAPFQLSVEWPDPVNGSTIELAYDAMRVLTEAGVWQELLDFQISNVAASGDAHTNWGWTAEDGRLFNRCNSDVRLVTERQLGTYLLRGLVPIVGSGGFGVMPKQGYGCVGPVWHQDGGILYPQVQQERIRGFWMLHPSAAAPAGAVYTAPYNATYRFVGDFARHSTERNQGDGVTASVVKVGDPPLFSQAIGPDHDVDPDNVFGGASNQHFDLPGVALTAGQQVRFLVASGGTDSNFDDTAMRVRIEYA